MIEREFEEHIEELRFRVQSMQERARDIQNLLEELQRRHSENAARSRTGSSLRQSGEEGL